jgi:hypothetical protein
MRIALLACLALAAVGCGADDPEKADPCTSGLCSSGGPGGPGSTGTGGSGTCTEAWSCTPWLKGDGGLYTRKCVDAAQCGTTAQKPPEGPVALPELDLDYFKCKVEPILDRGCAMMGCHGTEVGRAFKIYGRGRLRRNETVPQVYSCPVGPQMVNLQEEGSGTVMCVGWSAHTEGEWQENFDNARSFMIGITDPAQSDLLAQPVIGGKAHEGVHLFAKTDADYQTIAAWLGGAKLGTTCDPGEPSSTGP